MATCLSSNCEANSNSNSSSSPLFLHTHTATPPPTAMVLVRRCRCHRATPLLPHSLDALMHSICMRAECHATPATFACHHRSVLAERRCAHEMLPYSLATATCLPDAATPLPPRSLDVAVARALHVGPRGGIDLVKVGKVTWIPLLRLLQDWCMNKWCNLGESPKPHHRRLSLR